MGSEGFIVVAVGITLGVFIIKKFFKKKIIEKSDVRSKVLNDPELLVEKLMDGQGFLDEGKKLNYYVGEEDGKKVVMMKENTEPKVVKKVVKKPKKAPKKAVSKKLKKAKGLKGR